MFDDDDDECVRVKVVARDDGRASFSLFLRKSFQFSNKRKKKKKIFAPKRTRGNAETTRVDDRAKRETRRSLQNCAR